MLYKPDKRNIIFVYADKDFKLNLERLAVAKKMTVNSLMLTAAKEYLEREVKESSQGLVVEVSN